MGAILAFSPVMTCIVPVAAADNQTALPVRVVTGTATGTLGALNANVKVLTNGAGTVNFQLTGTSSQIVTPQVSLDNVNWSNVIVTPYPSGAGSLTVNSTGIWSATVAGAKYFQLLTTSYTSGSLATTLSSSFSTSGVTCISGCIPTAYVASTTAGTNMVQTGTAYNPILSTTLYPSFLTLTDSGLTSGSCTNITTGGLFSSSGFGCGTTTAASFTIPALTGTVTVTTTNPVTFLKYTPITITDGTNNIVGYVNATVSNATSFVLNETTITQGAAANTMATTAEVIVAGGGGSSSSGITSITGTTNQITASTTSGATTLSIPSSFVAPGSIMATNRITSNDTSLAFYTGTNNQTRSYVAQNTVTGSGNSNLGPAPSATVNGVTANVWNFSEYDGNTLQNNLFAIDSSGNAGALGAVHATSFYGSGANLTAGTIPNAALVTTPITSLTCSANVVCGSGTTPTVQITANPTFTNTTTQSLAVGAAGMSGDSGGTGAGYMTLGNGSTIGPKVTYITTATNSANAVRGIQGDILTIYNGNGSFDQLGVNDNGDLGIHGSVYANIFNGSGAGLTSATIPNAALVTPAVTGLTSGNNMTVGTGTTPSIATVTNPLFANVTDTALSSNICVSSTSGGLLAGATNGYGCVQAAYNTASFTSPAVGSTVSIPLSVYADLQPGVSLDILGNTGAIQMRGHITAISGSTVTFQVDKYAAGASGTTVAIGAYIYPGAFNYVAGSNLSLDPSTNTFALISSPTVTGTMTAGQFTGSGAGLTSATVPNAALVTSPVTGLTAGSNMVVGTGTTPSVALSANPSVTTLSSSGLITALGNTDWLHSYSQGCGTINWNSATGTGAAGVSPTGFSAFCNSSGTHILTVDTAGDLGIAGQLHLPAISNLSITAAGAITVGTANTIGTNNTNITMWSSGCSGNQGYFYSSSGSTATVAGSGMGFFCNSGVIMALDSSGNFGIAGSYHSGSKRSLKNNIKDLSIDKVRNVLRSTKIVQYCYKTQHCKPGQENEVGYIADDTDSLLSGPHHDQMDIGTTASFALAAAKDNDQRVVALEKQTNILEIAIAFLFMMLLIMIVVIARLFKMVRNV